MGNLCRKQTKFRVCGYSSRISVADPDPYGFGPPESGSWSISTRYGSGSGAGSFYHQAKIVRKTLNPTVLWLLQDFLSLKNDVNVTSKSNNKKTLTKFCVAILQDPNPDALVRGTNPRIRILAKNVTGPQRWIKNTYCAACVQLSLLRRSRAWLSSSLLCFSSTCFTTSLRTHKTNVTINHYVNPQVWKNLKKICLTCHM